MKKIALTIAIILGLSMTTFADPNGGGLFQRGETPESSTRFNAGDTPLVPLHNQEGNQNAEAPLGTGIAVLMGLGTAYLIGKKRREE